MIQRLRLQRRLTRSAQQSCDVGNGAASWLVREVETKVCITFVLRATNYCCAQQIIVARNKWLLRATNDCCVQQMTVACNKWLLRATIECCVQQMTVACNKWVLRATIECCVQQMTVACNKWLLRATNDCCVQQSSVARAKRRTGWWRLVECRGCLKLPVISAREPLIIGLFCGKWPVKNKALDASLPPCIRLVLGLWLCCGTISGSFVEWLAALLRND